MVLKIVSKRPDEFGFLYGQFKKDGQFISVDIMPPQAEWCGGEVLEGFEPHATQWVLYANGEEIARIEKREDLFLTPALPDSNQP